MKRLYLTLVAMLSVFLFANVASAQYRSGSHQWQDLGKRLNGVLCTASDASRTITLPTGSGAGYAMAKFQIAFVYGASTAVTMTCYSSINGKASWGLAQVCNTVTPGTCTSVDALWSNAVAADEEWPWEFTFLGGSDVKCIVACVGSPTTDALSVWLRLSTY